MGLQRVHTPVLPGPFDAAPEAGVFGELTEHLICVLVEIASCLPTATTDEVIAIHRPCVLPIFRHQRQHPAASS